MSRETAELRKASSSGGAVLEQHWAKGIGEENGNLSAEQAEGAKAVTRRSRER